MDNNNNGHITSRRTCISVLVVTGWEIPHLENFPHHTQRSKVGEFLHGKSQARESPGHSLRSEVKFFQICRNCYTMHTFPNLFFSSDKV